MTKLWETSPLTEAATAGLLAFAPSIRIADCTLRDGEQQAGIVLNPADKLAIARALDALGVYEIEAGTPASSKEDREAVETIAAAGLSAKVSALARARRDDVDELAAIGCRGARLSFPISNIQRQAKFAGMSDDKYLSVALEITEYVKERGLECIFSPFDTTRCDLAFLRRVLGEFSRRGTVDRVRVVDTTGCATPHIARYLVRQMKEAGSIPIEAHFHDDFGLAVANTIAAAEAGAEYLSVTMNGIGERAGNASLEETVVALKVLYGIDTGIRTEKLTAACRLVEETSGVTLQRHKAVCGKGAFAHESGMVVAALMKDPFAAECYVPELVGQARQIVYGKKSGAAAIKSKLDELGLETGDAELRAIVDAVKTEALRLKRSLDDAELVRVANAALAVARA